MGKLNDVHVPAASAKTFTLMLGLAIVSAAFDYHCFSLLNASDGCRVEREPFQHFDTCDNPILVDASCRCGLLACLSSVKLFRQLLLTFCV